MKFYLKGGECTLNRNLEKIVEFLHAKGQVVVFTNGNLFLNNRKYCYNVM